MKDYYEIRAEIEREFGPLPADLGSLQCIVDDEVIRRGDVLVEAGKPVVYLAPSIGLSVAQARNEGCLAPGSNVYRRIPVPKPVDGEVSDPSKFTPSMTTATSPGRLVEMDRAVSEFLLAAEKPKYVIPQDDKRRKSAPMFRGLLGYFPAALFAVAEHSQESDQKHNPGNEAGPHWAREKSNDHLDCVARHTTEAGNAEPGTDERYYHLRANAWRALAALQEECEFRGARPGISSKFTAGSPAHPNP